MKKLFQTSKLALGLTLAACGTISMNNSAHALEVIESGPSLKYNQYSEIKITLEAGNKKFIHRDSLPVGQGTWGLYALDVDEKSTVEKSDKLDPKTSISLYVRTLDGEVTIRRDTKFLKKMMGPKNFKNLTYGDFIKRLVVTITRDPKFKVQLRFKHLSEM